MIEILKVEGLEELAEKVLKDVIGSENFNEFKKQAEGNYSAYEIERMGRYKSINYEEEKSNNMRMTRISKDEYYLGIALAVSKRSACLRRHYGAIIVNNNEIVSTGYNGSPRGEVNCCDLGRCKRMNKPHNSGDYSDCCSVHAEQNAMLSASRKEMLGAVLYLTGEEENSKGKWEEMETSAPCPICMRMIQNAGIKKIVSRGGVVNVYNSSAQYEP